MPAKPNRKELEAGRLPVGGWHMTHEETLPSNRKKLQ